MILKGGAADEAPQAYKRLDEVLAAHADTIDIAHRLTPIGVAMATADTSTRSRTDSRAEPAVFTRRPERTRG